MENSFDIKTIQHNYPCNIDKFNEEFVYKSCNKEWIVVLQKLPDTITNEVRSDVKNKLYAKFRANKLIVVDIIYKFDNNRTINQIENSVYSNKIIVYKKGNIVSANFDENLNKVCAPGIHYFKSLEAAFYYEIPNDHNGLQKIWYDNGQLYQELIFKDGKYDGLQKEWYKNGQLYQEITYKDEKKDGLNRKWFENGKLYQEITWKNGKYNDLCRTWYENEQLSQEIMYTNGIQNGLFKCWSENGILIYNGIVKKYK